MRGLGLFDTTQIPTVPTTTAPAITTQGSFWGSDGFTFGDLNTLVGSGLAVYNTVTGGYTNTQTGQVIYPQASGGNQSSNIPGYIPPSGNNNNNNQVKSGLSTGAIIGLSALGLLAAGGIAYVAFKPKNKKSS